MNYEPQQLQNKLADAMSAYHDTGVSVFWEFSPTSSRNSCKDGKETSTWLWSL